MNITREAKLYPKKHQLEILENLLEESRTLYNTCLEIKKTAYDKEKKSITRFELQKQVKGMGNMPATLRQMVVYRLNNSYENFLRKGGYPRFKKQGRYRSIALRQYNIDYKIEGSYLNVWRRFGLGYIKIRGLQKVNNPSEGRLVKRESGWYFQVCDEVIDKQAVVAKKTVGIDFGLKNFIVDTTGKKIQSPKFFRKSENRLAILQRRLSKSKKSGKNRSKRIKEVRMLHEKIFNQRKDWLHKISFEYANKYELVAIEDLNVRGMVKNKHLSKSISDASWSKFADLLDYKLRILGRHLVRVNPQYTSQKCSSCGEIVKKSLAVRTHICLSCGLVLDRDENASRNIIKLGLDKAIAEGISIEAPMKQKAS